MRVIIDILRVCKYMKNVKIHAVSLIRFSLIQKKSSCVYGMKKIKKKNRVSCLTGGGKI